MSLRVLLLSSILLTAAEAHGGWLSSEARPLAEQKARDTCRSIGSCPKCESEFVSRFMALVQRAEAKCKPNDMACLDIYMSDSAMRQIGDDLTVFCLNKDGSKQ